MGFSLRGVWIFDDAKKKLKFPSFWKKSIRKVGKEKKEGHNTNCPSFPFTLMFLAALGNVNVTYHIPAGAHVALPPDAWCNDDGSVIGNLKDLQRAEDPTWAALEKGGSSDGKVADVVMTTVGDAVAHHAPRPSSFITLPYDQAVEWLFNQALGAHCHNRAPMSIPLYFTFDSIAAIAPHFDRDDARQVTSLIRDKVLAMVSAIFSDKYRKRPMALAQLVEHFKSKIDNAHTRFTMQAVAQQCNSCSTDYTSLMQFPLNYLNCGYLWRSQTSTTERILSDFSGINRCSGCYQHSLVDDVTAQIMAMWKLTSWSGSTATIEQLETGVDWALNFVDSLNRRVCLWCVDWISPDQIDMARVRAAARQASSSRVSVYDMFPSLPMRSPYLSMHSFTAASDVPWIPRGRFSDTVFEENKALRAQNHRLQEQLTLMMGVDPEQAAAMINDPTMPVLSSKVAPRIPSHSVDPDTMSDRHAAMQTEADAHLADIFPVHSMDPPDYLIFRAVQDAQKQDRSHNAPRSKVNYTAEAIARNISHPGPVRLRGGGHNVKGNARYASKIAARKNKVFTLTYAIDGVRNSIQFGYVQFAGKAKAVVTNSDTYTNWVDNGRQDLPDTNCKSYNLLTGRIRTLRLQRENEVFKTMVGQGLISEKSEIPADRVAVSDARINGVPFDWSLIRDNVNDPDEGLDRFCAELPDLPPMSENSASTNRIVKKIIKKRQAQVAELDEPPTAAPPPPMFGKPTVGAALAAKKPSAKQPTSVHDRLMAKTKSAPAQPRKSVNFTRAL